MTAITEQRTRIIITNNPEDNRNPEILFNFTLFSQAKYEYAYAHHVLNGLEDPEKKQALETKLKPFAAMQGWSLPAKPLEKREDPDVSIRTLQNGLVAFQDIVVVFLPLVKYVMKKIPGITPQNSEDIRSAGVTGLIDAVGKHPPDAPYLHLTYAEIRIKGEIIDYLRSVNPLSRNTIIHLQEVSRAEDSLTRKNLQNPTEAQIAEETKLPLTTIRELRTALSRLPVSLDKPTHDGGESEALPLTETIPGEENIEGDLVSKETRTELFGALYRLPHRDRVLLQYYYGEGMIMKEIAGKMGLSEARIHQLHAGAIGRLQKDMGITGRKETPHRVFNPSEFAALTAPTASLNVLAQEKRARSRDEALKRISSSQVTPTERFVLSRLIGSDSMVLLKDDWVKQIRPDLDPSSAISYLNTIITSMRPKLKHVGITLDSIYFPVRAATDKRPSAIQLTVKNTRSLSS